MKEKNSYGLISIIIGVFTIVVSVTIPEIREILNLGGNKLYSGNSDEIPSKDISKAIIIDTLSNPAIIDSQPKKEQLENKDLEEVMESKDSIEEFEALENEKEKIEANSDKFNDPVVSKNISYQLFEFLDSTDCRCNMSKSNVSIDFYSEDQYYWSGIIDSEFVLVFKEVDSNNVVNLYYTYQTGFISTPPKPLDMKFRHKEYKLPVGRIRFGVNDWTITTYKFRLQRNGDITLFTPPDGEFVATLECKNGKRTLEALKIGFEESEEF